MDERAAELTKLYQDHGPAVWSYAARRVAVVDEADDVLQETFVAAAKNFDGLRGAHSQKAWLIGIARNVIRHWTRNDRRRRCTELPRDHPATPPQPRDPRVEAMRTAIQGLPEPQQEVLVLRLSNELSYSEIAEALEVPIGTVRSRLHAAMTSLREWAADERTRGMREAGAGA